MLTSFFEKSRPVNFLILGSFIFVGYILTAIFKVDQPITASFFFYHSLYALLCVGSLFLLNFIIVKNDLTHSNAFGMFFYSCFLLMLPVIFVQNDIIIANFFLLLAFRRIISLNKDTNSARKILDASVWITIASLAYFWSLLFFIPLWIAIILKPNSHYKQMLMPIVGFAAVMIIAFAYRLLAFDSYEWILNWRKPIGLDFSVYGNKEILVPATIILGFYIWTASSRLFNLKSISLKERPKQILLLQISFVAFVLAFAVPEKTGAELFFTLVPTAIITAGYFDKDLTKQRWQRDKLESWFKEIVFWMAFLAAIFFLILWQL